MNMNRVDYGKIKGLGLSEVKSRTVKCSVCQKEYKVACGAAIPICHGKVMKKI
jgi:hypothetical protein